MQIAALMATEIDDRGCLPACLDWTGADAGGGARSSRARFMRLFAVLETRSE